MTNCPQCHLVNNVKVFPYRCVCGQVYGEPQVIPKPGTALKNLIAWFPVPNKQGCRSCRNLEAKMNRWGPDKCKQKINYIAKKLWIAAKRRNLPYSRRLVLILINKAINS